MVNEQGHLIHQHHDQLAYLDTTMREILHILHCLDIASEVLHTPIKGPPTTDHHSEPVPQPTQPSTQVSNARLSLPEKYDRTLSKCSGFLLQCSLYFAYQTGSPIIERSKGALGYFPADRKGSGVGYGPLGERRGGAGFL